MSNILIFKQKKKSKTIKKSKTQAKLEYATETINQIMKDYEKLHNDQFFIEKVYSSVDLLASIQDRFLSDEEEYLKEHLTDSIIFVLEYMEQKMKRANFKLIHCDKQAV